MPLAFPNFLGGAVFLLSTLGGISDMNLIASFSASNDIPDLPFYLAPLDCRNFFRAPFVFSVSDEYDKPASLLFWIKALI
jgi:hypothetical protein